MAINPKAPFTLLELATDRKVHYNTVKTWAKRMGLKIFQSPGIHGVKNACLSREDGIRFINQHISGIKPKARK